MQNWIVWNITEFGIMYPTIADMPFNWNQTKPVWRCLRGEMVKDWGIAIAEFELRSRYYVHFQTNTLKKCMDPLSS